MNTDSDNPNSLAPDRGDHHPMAELLPDFALGILPKEDTELVSSHLAGCEFCQARLRAFEQTIGILAFGVPQVTPPDRLKDQLMSRIQTESRKPSGSMVSRFHLLKQRLTQWSFSPGTAFAGVALIVCLATVNLFQWQQSQNFNHQLSTPLGIHKMRGTPLAPHADGTFVIGQDLYHGVLVASDLPDIPEGKECQLWLIQNGTPTSGGVFSTTKLGYGVLAVTAPQPLTRFRKLSVTMEPEGGSPHPTGKELMVGKISL